LGAMGIEQFIVITFGALAGGFVSGLAGRLIPLSQDGQYVV